MLQFRFFLLLFLSLVGWAGIVIAAPMVSLSGAATYNIPIVVPPGINGMQPNISLNYNSQRGNGLLGMGWALAGLSTITRCAQTVAQDGVKGGINFDTDDRFCLDGQRLIAVAGIYGATGTEYRTEIDSFSRIISSGLAGAGPASFTVETKTGKTMEYGISIDSRIEAEGKSDVISWALNKITGRQGNEITFTYTEDNAAGHYHISRIDYAGNSQAGVLTKASVRFIYESRSDIESGYVAGSKYSTPVRMTNIKTYATLNSQEIMVRDYTLTYEYSIASGRSRLLSSTEYDGTLHSKPTITFEWLEDTTLDFQTPIGGMLLDLNFGGESSYTKIAADLNGDGKTDLVWMYSGGQGLHVNTAIGNGDGTFQTPKVIALSSVNFGVEAS